LTGDQLSAIRGLGTRLAIITESHTGSYLGGASPLRDNVDLRAALRGEQVVVFSLNSSSYGKLAAQLGAIAIQDLITVAGERMADPSLRHPASVAVDEFSALDRGGDHVLGLNARCREAGIGALVSAQEPTDFERAARGLLNQILGSTAVKIVHRLDVPSSAEMVAQLAGTHTVWEQSHHVEHHPLFGDRASGRSVVREVERFLVHPNVIKSLPTGRAVVITKVPETRVRIVDVAPPTRPPGSVRTADLAASGRVPRAADSGGSGRVPRTADSGGSGRVARVWPTRPPVRRAGVERSYGESTQRLPEPERDGPEAE
jgi:conjugal transfer pilus assembly protein TraD